MNKIVVNQIIKFLLFSGFAALTNIFLRLTLSDLVHLNFCLAISVSYFIGMIINFSLNKKFNFPKGPRKYAQEMQTFFVIALAGFFLTNILSGLFLKLMSGFRIFSSEKSKTIAHILAVGIVSIYSFVGHKYFTYSKGLIFKFPRI